VASQPSLAGRALGLRVGASLLVVLLSGGAALILVRILEV
jgi:hypothetical protein